MAASVSNCSELTFMAVVRLVTSRSCSVPVPVRLVSVMRDAFFAAPRPAAGSLKRTDYRVRRFWTALKLRVHTSNRKFRNGQEETSRKITKNQKTVSTQKAEQKSSQNEETILLKYFCLFQCQLLFTATKTSFCASVKIFLFSMPAFSAALFILTFHYIVIL